MSMTIKGDTFTTFDDLWEASNLTQAEKDEIQLKIDIVGKLIEAREQKGISQKRLAEAFRVHTYHCVGRTGAGRNAK